MCEQASQRRAILDKVITVDALHTIRERYRQKKIVLCHGAFDLVHTGHLIHFEEAKSLGDILVVTITGDNHVRKKRAVSLSAEHRVHQVAALEIVDFVCVINDPSAVPAIDALRPDIYVKGSEYANLLLDKTTNIVREKAHVERNGGRIHFTEGETFSSTKLSYFLRASSEASQDDPLLTNERIQFRDVSQFGFALEELKDFLVRAAELRVCLIGETIVDEWVDVTITSLSQKSRCIAGRETGRITQIGGAGIIALHLASFVKEVTCFTNALYDPLPSNITVRRLSRASLVKTRYVDRDDGHPLFESKRLDLPDVEGNILPSFDDYDLVLVADYGHGLIDPTVVNTRIDVASKGFVAAMAQVNSSNYGYSHATKYVGADYYSLNRTEAELCVRAKGLSLSALLQEAKGLLRSRALSVTDGDHGTLVEEGGKTFHLPALSTSVVDTIGCGDAYFALSSLAACLHLPARMIALTGSIGAAEMARQRCNDHPVSEQEFMTIAKIVI